MERAQQTKKDMQIRLSSSSLHSRAVDGPWRAQRGPSPFLIPGDIPFPAPPSWISNILITSPILKSASQAIIQALLMTPSAKVSIRQVGIRRAENRAGQRAEHKSILV